MLISENGGPYLELKPLQEGPWTIIRDMQTIVSCKKEWSECKFENGKNLDDLMQAEAELIKTIQEQCKGKIIEAPAHLVKAKL